MATSQDLAAALRRRTLQSAGADPTVRGANWRQATVATVSSNGTVTTTDGIVARRLESYPNPTVGDLIRIDSAAGGWTALGRLATSLGGWTAYAPTWGASTTAPVIGNAVRTGRYQLLTSRTCHVALRLVPGISTNVGAGTYTFSVPFPSADDVVEYVGTARLTAASITYIGQCFLGPNASVMNATFPASATPATAANMTHTTPAAFASGHILRLNITYQIA